jgi:hypothetical protein
VPMWLKLVMGESKLWLDGCSGSEPRLDPMQEQLLAGALVRPPRLGKGMRAVPRLNILYPGFALQLREITENLSHSSRKVLGHSAPNTIRLVELAIAGDGLDWSAGSRRPWLTPKASGPNLGQRRYLPSCRTRGFPTPANFESKLAVRALTWSANSGTPWSSCICLLLTYQGAPVARRRHLDCNTCSLRTWERAADLQAGQA